VAHGHLNQLRVRRGRLGWAALSIGHVEKLLVSDWGTLGVSPNSLQLKVDDMLRHRKRFVVVSREQFQMNSVAKRQLTLCDGNLHLNGCVSGIGFDAQ